MNQKRKYDVPDCSFHSRAYHKYFQGYVERIDPESGKIRRIYAGEYYRSELSDRQLARRKLLSCLLLLAALALWASLSLSGLPGINSRLTSFFIALSLFSLLFTVIYTFFFCTAPREMTIYKYKESSVYFRRMAFTASATLAGAGLAELIYVFRSWAPGAFGASIGYFAAAAFLGTLFYLEHQNNYLHLPNPNESAMDDNDSSEITL